MEGVQTMFAKFIDVIQTFLTEPAILIGILVGVGYALDKKTPIKIITGMISAMVGLMMVLFGAFNFQPLLNRWRKSLPVMNPSGKARCLACLADMLMLPTDAMFICGPRSRA
ncbi:PTS transport protein, component II [Salmonella enterica subsp. arizonae]|uniref:Ascorbate-specific PTS system EIIC component n=1 Tax=Salmonella enterica subsp. arizonae TaxID=59203 RepID=A0A2X4TF06_SALER|nr:PTS transport protein, component II [Salmonella enterica subsp. arizonae]